MSEPTTEPAASEPAVPTAVELRSLIRRRKRADRLFAGAGAALIFLSLGVLLALVVGLFRDGAGRLLATHEVEPDGQAPAFRDVIGTVRPAPPAPAGAPPAGWMLQPDKVQLRLPKSVDVKPLLGKRVAVVGFLPRTGERIIDVEEVEPIEPTAPGGKVAGRPDVVGVILDVTTTTDRGETMAVLDPDPLRIVMSDDATGGVDFAALEGKRVAIDAGRRGRDPARGIVTANEITPLQAKSFFTSMPSMSASRAGILPAVVGTLLVMLVTMLLAVPLGVAAGVYLEEYAPRNRLTALIEINIANLAGVPSIIWGLAGLALFIFAFNFERSILAAGLTLGLLVLPIVIIATREAIRAIPNTIREASIGLGATKWQTTRHHVLPYSVSGILTGSIIAMSRAIGETAPLVCIGAVLFITYLPPSPISHAPNDAGVSELQVQPTAWLNSKFTVVPLQIFDWVSRPQPEFHANAAAASIVLVVLTLGLNAIAIAIRYRTRKSVKW